MCEESLIVALQLLLQTGATTCQCWRWHACWAGQKKVSLQLYKLFLSMTAALDTRGERLACGTARIQALPPKNAWAPRQLSHRGLMSSSMQRPSPSLLLRISDASQPVENRWGSLQQRWVEVRSTRACRAGTVPLCTQTGPSTPISSSVAVQRRRGLDQQTFNTCAIGGGPVTDSTTRF